MLKLDDLEPGTLYKLKMGESIVYAKTLEATSSKTSCEKPSVVPPPVNLHVTELDNELEVSWDPPDCDSIVSYLIRNNGKVIGEGRVVQLKSKGNFVKFQTTESTFILVILKFEVLNLWPDNL